MARNLTENQQKFIEVLFDEAGGDVVAAKKLAGYSDNTPTRLIVESLKDEIGEATRTYFARTAPKAAMAMVQALYDPYGTWNQRQDGCRKRSARPCRHG